LDLHDALIHSVGTRVRITNSDVKTPGILNHVPGYQKNRTKSIIPKLVEILKYTQCFLSL